MENSKIAFIFPGQGSQYSGMGKELYKDFKESRDVFDEASHILGIDMARLCFENHERQLCETENTQIAILTHSISALRVVERYGIRPNVVAGLSLGEYSAIVSSGRLDFNNSIKLVRKRGIYMEEASRHINGGMAAILGLDRCEVLKICNECSGKSGLEIVQIANYNCPGQIVISGEINALKKACEMAKDKGAARVVPLNVKGPFHSSLLNMAAEKLEIDLENTKFNKGTIPLIANITADYIDDNKIREVLKRQVTSSVRWEDTISRMIKDGIDIFIEIGPGRVLSGFIKKINNKMQVYNVEDKKSLEKTLKALKLG